MHFHTPFHPFERHPISSYGVELGNLIMILLGILLVLLFKPWVN